MAFIASNWKITFDLGGASAFQLVDFWEEIDEELKFPWAQGVDTAKPLGARSALKFARGGADMAFTLGKWQTHATQAAARNYLLSHAASLPIKKTKVLTVEVYGGESFELSTAVIASGDGQVVPNLPGVGGVGVRTWIQYKVEGGEFTIV